MTYRYGATDDEREDDDLPICPTMDQLQDFWNTGHSYPGDDEDDDDAPASPSWD